MTTYAKLSISKLDAQHPLGHNKLTISRILEHLVLLGLFSNIILPPIRLGSYSFYLTTVIATVIFVIFFFHGMNFSKFSMHKSTLFLILLGIMVFFSSMNSYIALQVPFKIGDFIESVKYIQFIPYFLTLPLITKKGIFSKFHYYILLSVIAFLIVGLIQAFQIDPLCSIIGSLYSKAPHLGHMLSGGRIFITGSDPNVGASIATFFIFYTGVIFLKEKKYSYIIMALILFFLLLMTQSRTALIGFILSLLTYSLTISNHNLFIKSIVLMIVFTMIYLIVLELNLRYIIDGYQLALSGESTSLNVRLENIELAYGRFKESLLFGWGPAKAIHETIIDSEYALIIERYGLVGIFLFASFIFYLLRNALASIKKNASFSFSGQILFLYLISTITLMATNNLFSGYQLMSILILLSILSSKIRESELWTLV